MDCSTPYLQRLQLLTGLEGIKKLHEASVAVVGLGGVGSHAAEALARSGIGTMTLVDMDRIEESNLNRQLPALLSTLGRYKTEITAERIQDINPFIKINKFTCRYEPASSEKILSVNPDYVIDAIDSIPDKAHLIRSCLIKGIPVVSSMGMANRLDPLKIKVGDIKDTSVCPVARKLRKELRNYGIHTGVTVVYSIEAPLKTWDENRASLGSIIYLPGIAGYLLASLIIQKIII